VPYTNRSTARLIENYNNSEVATAIRCLIYKRCTFAGHRVVAEGNSTAISYFICLTGKFRTAMVIITLKTILNEKVSYHFCQVT